MPTLSQRTTGFLIALRWPLLAVGGLLAVAAFFPAQRLDFDHSIENMFARDDPLMPPYRRLKRTFGGNEIVMAAYVDDELLHPDGRGIRRLEVVSARLKGVPGVWDVLSLDQPMGERIVSHNSTRAARTLELFQDYTHDSEGKRASVVCMLDPEVDSPEREETIKGLRTILHTLPDGLPPGKLAGAPVMVTEGFSHVREDGLRLGWTSSILLAITIVICFRSLRWVVIPIAVVHLTLLVTQATLMLSGLQLSMVSSMLTAIVTVVGIATVIHVVVRFREGRLTGLPPRQALAYAGGLLAAPIFWACSTDAVGFASLTAATVGPVQDFGIMMAIGSLLVIASVGLLLPGLALAGRFDADPKRMWGEGLLDLQLAWLVRWVERRPIPVGLAALSVTGLAAAGVFRLQVESDFTRNFRADSRIVRSYIFVENHFGGAGVWDVVVPAPEQLDWKYLRRVLRLEDRLRREVVAAGANDRDNPPEPGLTKVISIADAVIAGSPVDLENVRVRFVRESMVRAGLKKMREKMPVFMKALYGEDPKQPGQHYLRIMLRARERQPSAQKRDLIEQVERIVAGECSRWEDDRPAEVTGYFVLLTHLVDSMIRDQWITFALATAGIGLMMCVAIHSPIPRGPHFAVGLVLAVLKSVLLALVALVPNAMPILFVMGLMGHLGLEINMGAAMIAAVSMGLSIDSSIHYITAFHRARREGKSVHEAIAAVHQSVGRAMVFSTLALVVGFSVLCTSEFVPTIYFGALVSLSMLGGLAGNLVVLPLLLKLVTR